MIERREPAFALSVDVEDYYQVQAFVGRVSRDDWGCYPSRVSRNTERLLDLFDESGARGTFFVLGWVARQHPEIVRLIAQRGHEVASHGFSHRMINELSPAELRREAVDSRQLLEGLCGARVIGFRAPSYSLNRTTLWALEVLRESGYEYDSSAYPIRRGRYGYPEGPVQPARINAGVGDIAEFPLPSVPLGPLRIPVLAGAYLRLLPLWASLAAIEYHRRRGIPLVINVHPWELDPDQPLVGYSRLSKWTHYARLDRVEGILRRVLHHGPYRTVAARLRGLGLLPPAPADGNP
jgi:polysaccharide deacetylase family protein (PEP-CTERM system associated)